MCVSTPKVGATSSPAPTNISASGLTLGSAGLNNRSSGIFGRLALTGGARAARQVSADSSPTPGTGTTAASPQGTVGLPSNYLGQLVYGGLTKPVQP
jgi:hypothetical protein